MYPPPRTTSAMVLARLLASAGRSEMACELAAATSDEFVSLALPILREATGVAYALVAELGFGAPQHAVTIGAESAAGPMPQIVYMLAGTPCHRLIAGGPCSYPAAVAELFPEDRMLADIEAEAYVGTALMAEDGSALGLLVLLHTEPLTVHRTQILSELLVGLRPRFEAALRERRAQKERALLVELTGTPDQTPLKALAKAIAQTLHVTAVAVYRDHGGQPRRCALTAGHHPGAAELPSQFAPELAELLYERGRLHVGEGVGEAYPDDPLFAALGAEAFAAEVVYGETGRAVGHVCIIHTQPMPQDVSRSSVYRLLTSRLSIELRRSIDAEDRATIRAQIAEAHRQEAVGQFAAGLGHDFNGLLTVIGAYSNQLAARLGATLAEQPELSGIAQACEKAAALCEQMMDCAGGDLDLTRRIDLSELAAEACQHVAAALRPRCTLRPPRPDRATRVFADPTALWRVLVNLIQNAVEAVGDAHGEVEIDVERVTLTNHQPTGVVFGGPVASGTYVEVRVSDTGVGLRADQVPRMFDPYYTTKAGGHGLGLAALLGTVRAHQGVVNVMTALGAGTIIRVLLPTEVGDSHAPSEVPPPLPEADRPQGRVLLVDDELIIRRSMASLLGHAGYEVITADNGLAAVEMFSIHRDRIDCVVMDLTMPGITGDAAVRRMQALQPDVPIILASGFEREAVDARLQGVAVFAVLRKPYRLQELLEVLGGAIDVRSRGPRALLR